MKFSKLLVLSALWLVGQSAFAAIVDGVRQRPVPAQAQEFELDVEFYLYNVKAHRFFLGANDYNTRASIGAKGYKVKFVESGSASEGTFEFTDCVETQNNAWKSVFSTADGQAIWVDNSSEAYRFWGVEAAVGGAYRLTNPVLENTFLGWKGGDDDTRLYLLAEDAANAGIDWWFVSAEDYQTYTTEWNAMEKQFNKAAELKAQIDIAVALGMDVATETALYENEAASVEELDAAIAPLKEKIFTFRVEHATAENPADLSSLIKNPNGDDGNKNWKGTAPSMEYTVFEVYNNTFTTYQDIENMPNGVYDVTLHAFHRLGGTTDAYASWQANEPNTAFLYAKVGEDSVTAALPHIFAGAATAKLGVGSEFGPDGTNADGQELYVPNNRQAAQKYFQRENDPYLVSLPVLVSDGKLRIGVFKKTNKGSDWTPWDTWGLSYKGSSAAALVPFLTNYKAALPTFEDLTDDDVYTEDYLNDYQTALAADINVSDMAQAVALIASWENARKAMQTNLDLWKTLAAVKDSAIIVAADGNLDPDYTAEIGEWAEFDSEEIFNARELTNKELAELIAEKRAAIDNAKKHPIGESDRTDLLVNPDFDDARGATYGWTGFKSAYQIKWGNGKASFQMPTDGGTATNKCAEAFSTTEFDLYQIVNNAPVGVYEISVQGFCRHGRGDIAWNNYQNQAEYSQPGKFPVYVYLNAKTTPFKSVFEEPVEEGYYKGKDSGSEVYVKDGVEFPDGMVSSAVAFADGMYKQAAYGLVAKEGDSLRIGVKGKSYGLNGEDDNWVIFDNFKLTWKGYQADVVQPVLEEEITKATALKEENMGKTVFAALETKLAAAEASLGGEGKVMFNCLSDLFDVEGEVAASKELFRPLEAAMTKLEKEMEGREEHSAYSEAETLFNTNTEKIANHEIEDADIENMVNEINSMISKLRMPDGTEDASDDNVIDMTDLIENAGFDEGVDGWKGTTATWGDTQGALAEFHNKNFDFYQDLAGLPAGTYTVTVQAFYRAGDGVTDYKNYFTVDSVRRDNAILYAKAFKGGIEDEDTVFLASAVKRLSSIIAEDGYEYKDYDSETVEGYLKVKTDTISYPGEDDTYMYTFLPNTMATANDAFLNDYFTENSVTIKIEEGQILRVGLMKENLIAQDWTIFDNWQLWYNGTASQKEQSDQATGVKDLSLNEKVTVEYFTLDGRKASRLQKGIMIQKVIFSNGATVVRKVRR